MGVEPTLDQEAGRATVLKTAKPTGTRPPPGCAEAYAVLPEHQARAAMGNGTDMFTIEQITRAHDRLGNAARLAQYVRALKAIGVEMYTSYIFDGHSEYFGLDGYSIKSQAAHERLAIADTSNREQFLEHLNLHNQQKTIYLEMSKGLADCGIQKWTVDTNALTMTFYDKVGHEMLMETIK